MWCATPSGWPDRLVLAIGVHPGKAPLFSADERLAMLEETCGPIKAAKPTARFPASPLTIWWSKRRARPAPTILIRGLRDGTDFDYEMQMAGMNETMVPEVQTVFLPASPTVRPITATLVRQIAAMGGDVSSFVPATSRRRG